MLLDAGATVDLPNAERRTPLLEALYFRCIEDSTIEIVDALLRAGANVSVQDNEGMSALYHAVERDAYHTSEADEVIIHRLLARGADASLVNADGLTPLARAYYVANPRAVRILRRIGAPFVNGDNTTPSPLHWAVAEGNFDTVRTLLDDGANREERSDVGETPLHAASRGGNDTIVGLLLERGADIQAKVAPLSTETRTKRRCIYR